MPVIPISCTIAVPLDKLRLPAPDRFLPPIESVPPEIVRVPLTVALLVSERVPPEIVRVPVTVGAAVSEKESPDWIVTLCPLAITTVSPVLPVDPGTWPQLHVADAFQLPVATDVQVAKNTIGSVAKALFVSLGSPARALVSIVRMPKNFSTESMNDEPAACTPAAVSIKKMAPRANNNPVPINLFDCKSLFNINSPPLNLWRKRIEWHFAIQLYRCHLNLLVF